MLLPRLMEYLVALIFLYNFEGVRSNRTTRNSQAVRPSIEGCAAYDLQGKIYNLAALKRKDGQPRFWAVSGQWNFTYNPCRPFSQGTTKNSDCFGDVAVCMGDINKARYQLIGTQSSFHYDINPDFLTPQLVYTNTRNFPNWKTIIDLKCDPSKKTPEDAVFDFISDKNGIWKFLITSLCSCPDGCPNDPDNPDHPDDPSLPSDAGNNNLQYKIPLAALSALFLAVPLVIYRNRIWRCIRRRRGEEDGERQPVIRGNEREDYGARPENPQNAPQPSSADPGAGQGAHRPLSRPVSGNHNPRANKNINITRNRPVDILGALA